MVQDLKAHSLLYVITIKCIKCAVEEEFSCMLQRPRLISIMIFGDLSLAAMIKQQEKIARKFSRVAKRWHPVA